MTDATATTELRDDAAGMVLPPAVHRPRVIPVLLLKGELLYKTVKFNDPKYVGDPRIAVKIFNDKSCDELVLLDIMASRTGTEPNYTLIEEIVSEAFMPVAYGGGIRTLEQVRRIFHLGVEKIVINTSAAADPQLVSQVAEVFGIQAVVGSIDAKKKLFGGYRTLTHGGRTKTRLDPLEAARRLEAAGAGEILITSIDRDGTFKGYDIVLVKRVVHAVRVPVIACGGAGKVEDLAEAVAAGGASAAAAGSLFVFQLPHRAVLITFPREDRLAEVFASVGRY